MSTLTQIQELKKKLHRPEVEKALVMHLAVAECAVVGKPEAERGYIVKC